MAPYSAETRVTLSPRLTAEQLQDASRFHRALDAWNGLAGSARSWDELTQAQQTAVAEIYHALDRQEHPCR